MASKIKASALKPGYSVSDGPSFGGVEGSPRGFSTSTGEEGPSRVFSTSAGIELSDISAASPMLGCGIA